MSDVWEVEPALDLAVSRYLGRGLDEAALEQAYNRLPVIVAFVKGYTRGAGFGVDGQPNNDLRAVIVSAHSRSLSNVRSQTVGAMSVQYEPSVQGFTLMELAVLNRYRRRAI